MQLTRAKDWLVGAAAAVLVQVMAVAILWWVVSDPAERGETGPAPAPTLAPERSPDGAPPGGMGEDAMWLADVTLEAGTVVTADSMLRDVRAVGQDVVARRGGLVAARVTVDATVPFEAVAEALGSGTAVRPADDGAAMVVRTVEALGRELRVVATGTVGVEAGRLVVEPTSIDVGGPDFLSDAIATAVRRFVTIEHDIEGLPEGLVLQDVTVQHDGFRADLRGEDVRLVQ
jgi:hypothetical protein